MGKLSLPHCRPHELIRNQTLRGLGVGKTLPLQTTTPRIDLQSNYFGEKGVGEGKNSPSPTPAAG